MSHIWHNQRERCSELLWDRHLQNGCHRHVWVGMASRKPLFFVFLMLLFPCWKPGLSQGSALAGMGVGADWAPLFLFFFANLLWIWAVGAATAAGSGRVFEESEGCDLKVLFLLVSQEVLSQSGEREVKRVGVAAL